MKNQDEIDHLVDLSKNGNRESLESLIKLIQDDIYRISLKMLWYPSDAEDATQEILIKVITHIGNFRKESAFKTWALRIAANHLITTRKRLAEKSEINIELYQETINDGLEIPVNKQNISAEDLLLVNEIKFSCLHGVLLFLDRKHRIAFILGEIFEVSGEEGAFILEITPQTFRKRLSRAREKIRTFLSSTCGLVNPNNPCRCEKMINYAVETNWVDPDNLQFVNHPCREKSCHKRLEDVKEWDELGRIAVLYKNQPEYTAPDTFARNIKKLVESGQYQLL